MKYIYYIIVVVAVSSILAAFGVFKPEVKISKPVLSINDRIISQEELNSMMTAQTSHAMTYDQFVESIIDKQLLIQEAIKMEINKEEAFRQSVEKFYEQSLINTLLNRKLDTIAVDVTRNEIARYRQLMTKQLFITKIVYATLNDARERNSGSVEKLQSAFLDLSDDVKFIVLDLDKGAYSPPKTYELGVIVYRLDDIHEVTADKSEMDTEAISHFIRDKKKELLMEEWLNSIRKKAAIWRKNG